MNSIKPKVKMPTIKREQPIEKVISGATTRLTSEVASLSAKRDAAIGVFKATEQKLEAINADLHESAIRFESMAAFAMEKRDEAVRMISDNDKTLGKIREILGA